MTAQKQHPAPLFAPGLRRAAGFLLICLLTGSTSCAPAPPAPVLLFAGEGTSPNDVRAIEALLRQRQIVYSKIDSAELDEKDASELTRHRLLIVPGGNFEVMGKHLAAHTPANVRDAVHGGLNYLGICAGAFIAGNSPYNGFNLTSGVHFPFYSAEARGIRKSAVTITTPDSQLIEHYWEDGPALSGWGMAVAKYPDGAPAVAQGNVGKGWMILVGTHPEAPDKWREDLAFTMPATTANAYATTLIDAALQGKRLPEF